MGREKRGPLALELWAKQLINGYPGVTVRNMTSSWRNGLAFCALIHRFRPDLIDYDKLDPSDIIGNCALAFDTAESKLGIPALLDPEDMAAHEVPDRLSVLTYVAQFYTAFKNAEVKSQVSPRQDDDEDDDLKSRSGNTSKSPSPDKVVTKRKVDVDEDEIMDNVKRSMPNRSVLLSTSNVCSECNNPVFISERTIFMKRVYHRTCLRCSNCNAPLNPHLVDISTDNKLFCTEKSCHLELLQKESSSALPVETKSDLKSNSEAKTTLIPVIDGNHSNEQSVDEGSLDSYKNNEAKVGFILKDGNTVKGDSVHFSDIPKGLDDREPQEKSTNKSEQLLNFAGSMLHSSHNLNLNSDEVASSSVDKTSITTTTVSTPETLMSQLTTSIHESKVSEQLQDNPYVLRSGVLEKTEVKTELFSKPEVLEQEEVKPEVFSKSEVLKPAEVKPEVLSNPFSDVSEREAEKDIVAEENKANFLKDPIMDSDPHVIDVLPEHQISNLEFSVSDEPILKSDIQIEPSESESETVDLNAPISTAELSLTEDKQPLKLSAVDIKVEDSEPDKSSDVVTEVDSSKTVQTDHGNIITNANNAIPNIINSNSDEPSLETTNPGTKLSLSATASPQNKRKAPTLPSSKVEMPPSPIPTPSPTPKPRRNKMNTLNLETEETTKSPDLTKDEDNYPAELNPFEIDEESVSFADKNEDSKVEFGAVKPSSEPKNPFEDDEDDETPPPIPPSPKPRSSTPISKRSEINNNGASKVVSNASKRASTIVPPPRPPPPQKSPKKSATSVKPYNPFEDDEDDIGEYEEERKNSGLSQVADDTSSISSKISDLSSISGVPTPVPRSLNVSDAEGSGSMKLRSRKSRRAPLPPGMQQSRDVSPNKSTAYQGNNASGIERNDSSLNLVQPASPGLRKVIPASPKLMKGMKSPQNLFKSQPYKKKRRAPPPRRRVDPLPEDAIKTEFTDLAIKERELERQGVALESNIRRIMEEQDNGEEKEGHEQLDEMIIQLWNIVNEKNDILRRQTELEYLRRGHRLEEMQSELEFKLRIHMDTPEDQKRPDYEDMEKLLLQQLLKLVDERNEVVEWLDSHRQMDLDDDIMLTKSISKFSSTKLDPPAPAPEPKSSKSKSKPEKNADTKEKVKDPEKKKLKFGIFGKKKSKKQKTDDKDGTLKTDQKP